MVPALNTPHTSLEGVPHPPSSIAPVAPRARRVSVVVLDGLGFEAARALDELRPLFARGAAGSLRVDFPSFTSPAVVSFMTGLGPRESGTRKNGGLDGVVGLDTLPLAAARAGLSLDVWSRGYEDFIALVAAPEGTPIHRGKLAVAVDRARRGLDRGAPIDRGIDLIHYGLIDDVGHEHGAASKAYRDAAREGATFVARHAESLDLDRDALVVVSDHGQLAVGGHGGVEPEILSALFLGVGAGFRAGVTLGPRPMRDVAPTIGVLAGIGAPTSSLGRPILEALALDDADRARALAAPFDQAARFACRLHRGPRCEEIPALAARLEAGDAAAVAPAIALHDALEADRDRGLAATQRRRSWRRLLLTANVLAIALWAAIGWSRQRGLPLARSLRWPALALPCVNVAVYAGYFLAIGYRPGFSFLKAAPELVADATPGALFAVSLTALFAFRFRPGPLGAFALLSGTAAPFALLAAWVGWDPTMCPPPLAGAAVFQLAPAVVSAACAAVLVAMMEMRDGFG